ncbi:MAG: recombinase family protein [Clostridia bacterium]|nr:recombinase family protein [Clostridia bacterium]
MKIRKIERKTNQKKIKVAAYCRVSTDKAEQEESFETQVRTYERMIRANPKWEYAGIYADEKSGTSDRREGFRQMISDAEAGAIQYILVKSISRFSRNVVDCREYIERLRKCGVTIYFEREKLESTAPGTSMILSLMAAIAQDESRSNSENHRWAIRRRYERGEYKLGNNQILGYDADENGRPIPNKDAWMVQMIFRLYAEGKSISQIAAMVNEAGGHCLRSNRPLAAAQISYILKNEVYVGDRLLQKKHPKNYLTKRPDESLEKKSRYLKDSHTGLIDRETWRKVQERQNALRTDNGGLRKRRDSHYLAGLVFCAECGMAYQRRCVHEPPKTGFRSVQISGSEKVWKCKGRRRKNKDDSKAGIALGCRSPIVRETDILNAIAEYLGREPTEEIVLAHVSKVLIGKEGIRVIGVKKKVA